MNSQDLYQAILQFFESEKVCSFPEEHGLVHAAQKDVRKIAYATNLSPQTIRAAIETNAQLILTHHDAWDFIYGMKQECLNILEESGVSAVFVHGLLDDADFGTSATLLKLMGAVEIGKCCPYLKKLHAGRIGVYDTPIEFTELVERLETILDEPVKAWKNHKRKVKKVVVTTGGGMMTYDMIDAFNQGCDAYITGEKILYSIMYAKHQQVDFLVGSHTFTEVPGVRSLAEKIEDQFPSIEIEEIKEEHME